MTLKENLTDARAKAEAERVERGEAEAECKEVSWFIVCCCLLYY